MTKRTLTAKTGKPVETIRPVAFLPNREAEREHAEMFTQAEDRRQDVETAIIEKMLGLR